jgi:hypothetical protein
MDGCKRVKNILGPSVAADGMPISKEQGEDTTPCLDYQKPHNLWPIRGGLV